MTDQTPILKNSTPFDLCKQDIDDLFEEAKNWLDGSEVKTQDEADAVAKLLDLTRKARKAADEARKTENKPFDDGKAEVQARYNPLLKRADLIASACKKANTAFLEKQDRIKREAERLAQEDAEKAEAVAQEAMRMSAGDIAAREEAEQLVEQATKAQKAASKLARDKGQAKGGNRAMGLRTTYRPELRDLNEAIKHYWTTNRPAFEALVCELAADDVRAGKREIPGFEIVEERQAV